MKKFKSLVYVFLTFAMNSNGMEVDTKKKSLHHSNSSLKQLSNDDIKKNGKHVSLLVARTQIEKLVYGEQGNFAPQQLTPTSKEIVREMQENIFYLFAAQQPQTQYNTSKKHVERKQTTPPAADLDEKKQQACVHPENPSETLSADRPQ
jgi:hypothetical protein